MRHLDDIIESYDESETGDSKKIQILRWFRRHPNQRVDRTELYNDLKPELDIGTRQLKNHLDELVEKGVLQKHGEKRQAYYLADDIVPPVRYEAMAALRHLFAIFDYQRWGVAGIAVAVTALWTSLTVPIWFLWLVLAISPYQTAYGPISQSELLFLSITMGIWLIIFTVATAIIYAAYRHLSSRNTQE